MIYVEVKGMDRTMVRDPYMCHKTLLTVPSPRLSTYIKAPEENTLSDP